MWRCCYLYSISISLLADNGRWLLGQRTHRPVKRSRRTSHIFPFQRTVSSQWLPAFLWACWHIHIINFSTHKNSSERFQKSNPSLLTFSRRVGSTEKHIPPRSYHRVHNEDLALPWTLWWQNLLSVSNAHLGHEKTSNYQRNHGTLKD